ncbi:SCO family protein [Paenibacillus daejeonensis]|uniref:SCO family protein n=1 Tax=Paenibacillus daejeonensis TaxID=135193 RepID=UPI00037226F4|nr:SCO family protein [Paenibacillus daejeonensis]
MSSHTKAARPYLIAAIILVAAFAAYLLYPLFQSKSLPVVMASPNFQMPDHEGNIVTQSDYDGQVRLMSFIFTRCPDICPATTIHMVDMQEELKARGWYGDQVSFVSATFDPDNDTTEVLEGYAERLGIDQTGWTLLRGEEADTIALAAEYGNSVQRLDDGLYVHSITSLLLIDGEHQVRKIYRMGDDINQEEILADIATLVEGR